MSNSCLRGLKLLCRESNAFVMSIAVNGLEAAMSSKTTRRLCLAALLAVFATLVAVLVFGKIPIGVRYRSASDWLPGSDTNGLDIVEAARRQIGVTVVYDSSYQKMPYPNGDIPRERGVCCDVVIRALRDARGMDLQKLVHEDMNANFLSYPSLTRWLLFKPDANIDHRRVLNLERFFGRSGWSLDVTSDVADYLPGDIVTCLIEGGLPHVMIVSDRRSQSGRPLVIHNIGAGAEEEDCLFDYEITGHHRLR